jgi:DtxR family Mn-dependent transcriptional regulator
MCPAERREEIIQSSLVRQVQDREAERGCHALPSLRRFKLSLVAPKTAPATSEAVDDYLKAILELSGANERRVTSNALASRVGVRAASVTEMLQKLAAMRPPLVVYEKHRGVKLSNAGKRRAWELVLHHRLLELFLHDVLKYSWDEVHEEAERLEHFISERFEDRVAALLGDPEIDPHGHVIARKYGAGDFPDARSLLDLPPGQAATITSVGDRDPATLRELTAPGIDAKCFCYRRAKNSAGIGAGSDCGTERADSAQQ